MNSQLFFNFGKQLRAARFLALLAFVTLFSSVTFAQQTAGGTVISNQASATYGDGTGNNYSTVSNTVNVTVANVSGLKITPDAGTLPTVVAGQTNVLYTLQVTNSGNFSDQVRFLASGKSVQISGPGTITQAVIDVNNSGTIATGDTDILTNPADVISASILQGGYIKILVNVNVNAAAAAGNNITVTLGDTTTGSTTFDNQPANSSANEVRTVSTASVNGLREAKGDVTATVENDAQLRLSLTAPAGPLNAATSTTPGSDINYTWQVCNTGQRDATAITLGSSTGVYIVAPIPVGTALKSGQTFPAGTLYSTTVLSTVPTAAVWLTAAPSDLTTVRRIAFSVGSTLAAGACSSNIAMAVTITTTNATLDIYEIGDTFGKNNIGTTITDQSGDTISNKGDGNADFDEPITGGNATVNQGFQQVTVLTRTGSVLIGPSGQPTAVGPTSNNDDFTNRSLSAQVAGLGFGSNTAAAGSIIYTNTIRNTGNANDTFTITRQAVAATSGFTVEISTNGGTSYTTMTTNSITLAIAYNSDANILVRVTAPTGTAVLQAGGFDIQIRATSLRTATAYNDTIDRLYTGFLRMTKTATISNTTPDGAATDPVPGAKITYTITYTNISSGQGSGSNNSMLTVSNLVITENGTTAPNNWGTFTTQVVGSGSSKDQNGTANGTITGDDVTTSTVLTDTVSSLAPGTYGTFTFSRLIK